MEIIIIGGGVAGLEGALAARKVDAASSIRIFCAENVLPYRRPALSGMIVNDLPDKQFFLKSAEELAAQKIEISLCNPIVHIDDEKSQVVDSKGKIYHFDRLLFACGARSFCPPVPGLEMGSSIIGLRDFADLQSIKNSLQGGAKNVIILGGGPLALEQAEGLINFGCQVTVLEAGERLLPRLLDADSSQFGTEILAQKSGLTMIFGFALTRVEEKNGKIYCHSADGKALEADLMLVSTGVRPVTDLAEMAMLQTSRSGIAVDREMRSSKRNIFAAGDCAALAGRNWGLFIPAKTMGAIAGNNLAGGEFQAFEPMDYPVRLAAFGLKLFAAGDTSLEQSASGKNARGFYKIFLDADKAAGVVTMGDSPLGVAAGKILANHLSAADAIQIMKTIGE